MILSLVCQPGRLVEKSVKFGASLPLEAGETCGGSGGVEPDDVITVGQRQALVPEGLPRHALERVAG